MKPKTCAHPAGMFAISSLVNFSTVLSHMTLNNTGGKRGIIPILWRSKLSLDKVG